MSIAPNIASKQILVVGAGVIGSVFASWFQAAGQQVSLLARGQRLIDLQTHGLVVENAGTGQSTRSMVRIVDHLAPADPYDLIVVAVRLDQADSVLPLVAANIAAPSVLFLLNNAFGCEQFAQAVGPGRAVLGFPGLGGRRDGATTQYYGVPQQPTTLGEADGRITPRLQELAALIKGTGHPVVITARMDAWLKTHAVFVTAMTAALDRAGGDSVALAHDRKSVATMVRAIREGFQALQAVGVPTTPGNLALLFCRMPIWFAVTYWQRALQGPVGTLAIAPHARAARGEMAMLAVQVQTLLQSSPTGTPTLHRLLATLTQSPKSAARFSRGA